MTAIVKPGESTILTMQVSPSHTFTRTLDYGPRVDATIELEDMGEGVVREALADLAEGRFVRHLSSDSFLSSLSGEAD